MRTKVFCLVVLFAVAPLALAEPWVTPNCRLTWGPPSGGAPLAGYMVYFEKQSPYELSNHDAGANLQYDCADAGLTPGRWRAWVTAYNVVGESAPSNVVPFELVDSAPNSPAGVAIGEAP